MNDKEKKEKLSQDRKVNDLIFVLSFPEGRRLIKRILDTSGIDTSAFVLSKGQREWTDFFCGRQDLGHWLKAEIIKAKPDVIHQIEREHLSREKMDEIDKEDEIKAKTPLTRS